MAAEPVLLAGDCPKLDLEWRRASEEGTGKGEMYLVADGAALAWLIDLDTNEQTVHEIVTIGELDVRLRR